MAYEALERYIRESGRPDISIKVSGFKTIYKKDFDRYIYGDLLTFPEGRLLKIDRIEMTNKITGKSGVEYRTRWKLQDENESIAEWRRRTSAASLQQIVQNSAKRDNPDWKNVAAVTSYTIGVSFDNRQRQYKALFFWVVPSDEKTARFMVEDHIIDRVSWALAEKIPPATEDSMKALRKLDTTAKTSRCTATSKLLQRSAQDYDLQGHKDGNHAGAVFGDFTCKCDSDCYQTCNASITGGDCDERGILTAPGAHKITSTTRSAPGSGDCAVARACAVQYCPTLESCGEATVSIQVLGSGLTVTFDGDIIWGGNLSINQTCVPCLQTDTCEPNCGDDRSPILIDLGKPGFDLTDLADGVFFDLDRDGAAEKLSWTTAESEDGFLVFDRNFNGKIDDGGELFGNFTFLDPDNPRHGYQALALYDEFGFGGNKDGEMTAEDTTFQFLRLWHDRNHDGIAQREELRELEEFGIEAISLEFIESRRRDRHGNEFRYRGQVRLNGRRPVTHSADVFLLSR